MNVTLLPALLLATTIALPEGGEVCRFRADDRENPFKRWLASQEVICGPANAAVEFPKGLWNVFARNADSVSDPVLVDGDVPPASLSFSMRPATAFNGTNGVAYLPRLAVAYPLPTIVPKDEPLWLFTLDKSKVISVDGSAVVGWLHVPPADQRAIESANGLTPPSIAFGSRDADLLPRVDKLHGAFVRVRNVPAGEGELTVGGRGWIGDRRRVKVQDAVTIVEQPLTVRATGLLTVYWDTSGDVVELDHSIGSCEDVPSPPQIEVSLFSCPRPERPNEPPDPKSCSFVRKEPFEPHLKFSSATFEELVPGFYRAEFRYGKLPPVSNMMAVAPLQQARLSLNAYYLTTYGSITHGGRPLGEKAQITFAGGVGFLPEGKDEHRAVMLRPLDADAQIAVEACDGEPKAVVLTDRPVRPNTRLDVDIPDNELTVTVTDTFTREPINGAVVKIDVMALRRQRIVMTRNFTVDDGNAVVKALPERELRISVSAAGYQRQNVEPFTMGKSETKELEVQLVPLRGNRGTIVSAKPFDSAAAYWFSPSGHETERAEVAPDGTFVYANAHTSEETLVIISLSHPLWVTRSPNLGHRQSEHPTLRFPDTAPARTFEVRLSVPGDTVTRQLSLTIGALTVPASALRAHQQLRRDQLMFRGGPVRVRDILETGPIEVMLDDLRQRLMPEATAVVFPVH